MALRSLLLALLLCAAAAASAAEGGDAPPPVQPEKAAETKAEQPAAPTGAAAAANDFILSASEGGTKLTLRAVNVPAKPVIEALAKESGWTIRVEGEPRGSVSADFTDQPFETALMTVARPPGYTASRVFVIVPKKEGSPLAPDVLRLPMGLPRLSLSLANPMPVAAVIATVAEMAHVSIEAPEDLKGEATLAAADTPLPDVLTSLCQQLDMAWTLVYQLKSAPTTGAGAVPDDEEVAAQEARRQAQQWARMTPQQRQVVASQQIGNLLRLDPRQRQQQVQSITAQLVGLSRGVAKLSPEERKQVGAMIQQRAQPYMSQMRQLTPEQQREFQPAARAYEMLINRLRQPTPQPRPATPGRGGAPQPPARR
ncbi:MAG: FlxA-like family protein [Armatimonadetes bacterium]|nr:FlxA-like family protein [Armatimonadota bacterium]